MNKFHLYKKLWFFLFLCLSLSSQAQSKIDNINEYNNLITLYSDSIKHYQQLHKKNKIDDINFQNKLYELNDLIINSVYLSNSIIQTTFDSIFNATHPEESVTTPEANPDVNTSVETSDIPDMSNMPEIPKQKKISPMAMAGKIMSINSGKKSKLGIQMSWYFNNWFVDDILKNSPTVNMFRSFNLVGDFSFVWRRQLGKESSPWYINYGIGLDSRKFVQTDDFLKIGYPFNSGDSTQLPNTLDRIKFRTQYVSVPLNLEYKIKKKLKISIGTYVGYKIKNSKTYYYTVDDHCVKQKYSDTKDFNNLIYGLSLSAGGRKKISFQYNLSDLLHDDIPYAVIQAWRIGYQIRI